MALLAETFDGTYFEAEGAVGRDFLFTKYTHHLIVILAFSNKNGAT